MRYDWKITSALFTLLLAMIAINFGYPIIGLGFIIGSAAFQLTDWLGEGWIPKSKLEEARDASLRRALPVPSRDNDEWYEWANKTTRLIAGDGSLSLPNKGNHAIFPYLCDEHDACAMEDLLNQRVWPPLCNCDRIQGRPWTFNHKVTCPHHEDYDRAIECKCIKKKRKGKIKTYRTLACRIHTTNEERRIADLEDEESVGEWIEQLDGLEMELRRSQAIAPHIFGPPDVTGTTLLPSRVDFECGCYALNGGIGYTIVRIGMCGLEHADLDNLITTSFLGKKDGHW